MNEEVRYETGFGSGQVMSPAVWHLIEQLHPLGSPAPEAQVQKELWNQIGILEAMHNGCPKGQENVAQNGGEKNALGDGRNNFIYGYILERAQHKVETGRTLNRWQLLIDLTNVGETIPENTTIEPQSVPSSYVPGGQRFCFAKDNAYSISSEFWRHMDMGRTDDERANRHLFMRFIEVLDDGIQNVDFVDALSAFAKRELPKALLDARPMTLAEFVTKNTSGIPEMNDAYQQRLIQALGSWLDRPQLIRSDGALTNYARTRLALELNDMSGSLHWNIRIAITSYIASEAASSHKTLYEEVLQIGDDVVRLNPLKHSPRWIVGGR